MLPLCLTAFTGCFAPFQYKAFLFLGFIICGLVPNSTPGAYLILSPFHREENQGLESSMEWPKIIQLMGFPGGSDGIESACNAGDLGSIPGLGRSPREENGNLLWYSCLENSMD